MKLAFPALFCAVLFFSCSKKDSTSSTPPVDPIILDTLTAGWAKYTAPRPVLADIFFADALNGYCLGDSGAYKSSDGGISWNKLAFSGNVGGANIAVASANRACFVGYYQPIFNTQNGTSVQSLATTVFGSSPSDCFFSSANTCYASGINYILKSTDGGITFNIVYNFPGSANAENPIFFINDQTGWVLRNDYLYKTADGGVTWNTVKAINQNPCKVQFINTSVGFYSTSLGVFKTLDGGANWQTIYTFANTGSITYNDISFITASAGYISDGRHIYKTTDGGVTWTMVLEAGQGIVEVQFIDANHGWVCGGGSKIFVFKQ